MRLLIVALVLGGCTEPEPYEVPQKPGKTTSSTTTGSGTTTWTTSTTPTTTPPTVSTNGLYVYDCSQPNPQVTGISSVGTYGPAEDFDFDANGNAIQVFSSNLTYRNKTGDSSGVITPGISSNAAGTRVLADGDYVVADVSSGEVLLVDHTTGAASTLFAAPSWPNGIEIDRDGYLYVSDFTGGSIVRFDPYDVTDNETIATGMNLPNGLALSPDEQILYVAGSGGDLFRIFRDPTTGAWDSGELFLSPGSSPQGINVDICGNVYWTDGTDRILRWDVDNGQVDEVAELQSGYLPNLRWGSGVGGWEVDHLYASDRFAEEMFEIPVGIPGQMHVMYE